MSIEAISWVIKQDIPDGVAKLVAMVLADYADRHTGEAHPKIRQLAEACSQSERSVQRKLRVLQDLDVLTIQLGHCPKSGRQRANSYILHLPGVDVPGRGDQIGSGYGEPSGRGDFMAPQNQAEGCPRVTGEGDSVVTGEGDSPVTPIENPSDSTVRKDSPQPPAGGRGAFPKLVRGNGITASVVVDRPAWRSGTPALDPPTAAKFERLWSAFPEGGRIDADRNAAERIFAGLESVDQDLAVTAAVAYAAHVRKHEARPKALHTWLRQRRFVNLRPSAAPTAAAPTNRVFVRDGSPEWEAWARHLKSAGRPMHAPMRSDLERADGWWFPSLTPPAVEAA